MTEKTAIVSALRSLGSGVIYFTGSNVVTTSPQLPLIPGCPETDSPLAGIRSGIIVKQKSPNPMRVAAEDAVFCFTGFVLAAAHLMSVVKSQ